MPLSCFGRFSRLNVDSPRFIRIPYSYSLTFHNQKMASRPVKRKGESSSARGGDTRKTRRAPSSSTRSTPAPSQANVTGGPGQPTVSKHVTLHPPTSHLSTSSPRARTGNATSGTSSSVPDVEDEIALQEREGNDSLNEIIMAVDMRERGTVGCSYYVAREEKLYFMDDVLSGGIEVIDAGKSRIGYLCLGQR